MGGREGEEGREREGWVGAPLCEILNTPLCISTLFVAYKRKNSLVGGGQFASSPANNKKGYYRSTQHKM